MLTREYLIVIRVQGGPWKKGRRIRCGWNFDPRRRHRLRRVVRESEAGNQRAVRLELSILFDSTRVAEMA